MSAEGQFFIYLYLGIIAMIATILGKKLVDKAYQNKGFIGALVVCYFAAFILWFFAGDIAMTINVSRSDIYFVAIITAIAPTVLFLVRGREQIKQAGRITSKATRKTKSTAKKTRAKITGKLP